MNVRKKIIDKMNRIVIIHKKIKNIKMDVLDQIQD